MSDDEEIDINWTGPADIEINLSDDDSNDNSRGDKGTGLSRPATIDTPTEPGSDYSRGTFVFPSHDPGFMQRLELRGNNGAQRDVETVYLLTGESYTMPSELVQLDDPAIYNEMTPNSVSTKLGEIAEQLQRMYDGRPDPKLIGYVHTHQNGTTRPSSKDRSGSETAKRVFERYFDDFEFFNAIHALGDRADVPVGKMREPTETSGGVWWYGETRRHELAVFDAHYNARTVVVPE